MGYRQENYLSQKSLLNNARRLSSSSSCSSLIHDTHARIPSRFAPVLASEIAEKALNLWEREVSATYNCYEHFMIENGRGAGFHQFSGLSTPVLMWFESYYTPFSVTSGFRTLITDKKTDGKDLSFHIQTDSPKSSVIVCLREGKDYDFECDAAVTKINKAAYLLKFNAPGTFLVKALEK